MNFIDLIGEKEAESLRKCCEFFIEGERLYKLNEELFEYYKEINEIFACIFVPTIKPKDDELSVTYTINPLYDKSDFDKEEIIRINYILQTINYYINQKVAKQMKRRNI